MLEIRALFEIDNNSEIQVGHASARLIGSGNTLGENSYIKKLNSPSVYFVHCDLIDKNQNFLNNKKSDLLAKLEVSYEASTQQPFRDCSTDFYVKSITVSVRDENDDLFDFNGLPLEFELEIN